MQKIRLVMEYHPMLGRTIIRRADNLRSVLFEATEEWADLMEDRNENVVYDNFNDIEVELYIPAQTEADDGDPETLNADEMFEMGLRHDTPDEEMDNDFLL